MKRFISAILPAVMLATTLTSVSALDAHSNIENISSNSFAPSVEAYNIGHGEFRAQPSSSQEMIVLSNVDSGIELNLYSSAGIYTDNANTYYLNVMEDTFLKVSAVDIDLCKPDEMEEILNLYDVNEELRKDLREDSEDAIKNSESKIVTIYTPSSNASLRSTEPPHYYTYNGAMMKDEIYVTTDKKVDGRTMATGSAVLNVAQNIAVSNFFSYVDGSETLSSTVKLFSKGVSLFSVIKNLIDSISFTADSGNYIKFKTEYDLSIKYTSVDQHDGKGFQLGAKTMSADFHYGEFKVQLYNADPNGNAGYESWTEDAPGFEGVQSTPGYTNGCAAYAYGASGGGYLYQEDLFWVIHAQTFNP